MSIQQNLNPPGHPRTLEIDSKQCIISELISKVKLQGALDIRGRNAYLGYIALHYAASAGWNPLPNFNPVKLLLDAGADPNSLCLQEQTPLEVALSSNLPTHDAIVNISALLNAGADPNRKCGNGLTPLHLAVSMACQEIVHLLVQAGADITQALMVLISADLERALELTALVSCVEGWAGTELRGWGMMAQRAVTIWDYYYIWRRKHLENYTQSR
ncbi:ankyrin repeat-containing domain protein [Rhypophila decipiens]|uniref:Ankyrin repeat-containing domain protein n=1 Tax=Rhypophila decipiens TaxID=261697 RepID=A0AAN7BBU6_9PEZI|nr:ankyrin repeat-containing domain protein [Rhypophila decipiens]